MSSAYAGPVVAFDEDRKPLIGEHGDLPPFVLASDYDALAAQRDELVAALAGLVGSSNDNELTGMELATKAMPIPDEDKAPMLSSIRVLRAAIARCEK